MSDPVKLIVARVGRRCTPLATATLRHARSKRWQSLLFDGGRHSIDIHLDGPSIEDALVALEEEIGDEDFAIPGHILADIRVTDIDRDSDHALVRIDALTIDGEA